MQVTIEPRGLDRCREGFVYLLLDQVEARNGEGWERAVLARGEVRGGLVRKVGGIGEQEGLWHEGGMGRQRRGG